MGIKFESEGFDLSAIAVEFITPFQHCWQRFCEEANLQQRVLARGRPALPLVWAYSDFVSGWCIRHPARFSNLILSGELGQKQSSADYSKRLSLFIAKEGDDEVAFDRGVRKFRMMEMVRLAWRDLAGIADLEEAMTMVSGLADACIEICLQRHQGWLEGRFGCPRDQVGNRVSMVVLGLGKLGGRELNYSSDIDLIFAFEEGGETDGTKSISNQEFFIKLGRKMIGSLDRMDREGFVFRTDMRLRPNGESGPLVLSFAAMEHYYQTHGRDWERYAMIKARVVAGDSVAGATLLGMLKPFVYRKYLDYSAFDAIRQMKGQIVQQLKTAGNALDIKLGWGGIREIEFLVQNHQLIRGGREGGLQTASLYQAMEGLVALGLLNDTDRVVLLNAYRFLRNVEHRLQMVADRQTQRLPESDFEQLRLARSMGFDDWATFLNVLDSHREGVDRLFGQVLATRAVDQEDSGLASLSSLWLGELEDDVACEVLVRMGFSDSQSVVVLLGQFRQGSLYQVFTNVERDRMDRLMPLSLIEAAKHQDAARAVSAFIAVLESIGRRSVYLSLLIENPMALKQLLHLCAASPWLSRHIGQHPVVLDELLQPLGENDLRCNAELAASLKHRLAQGEADDEEARMDTLREFYHAQVLRIAAADVGGQLTLAQILQSLSRLAEVLLGQVLEDAIAKVSLKLGSPPGQVAVIAYGKFAGRELGYHSDLDIVVCFEPDEGVVATAAEYYFSKVGQRLIHLLTTRTHAGILFELDMRLRPSGRSGTLVTSLKTFREYQNNSAWTWEHQALVRARVVVGSVQMVAAVDRIRAEILTLPREMEVVKAEVREMRQRMVAANSQSDAVHYDMKLDVGGIVDIEFLLQYLVLVYGAEYPEIIVPRDSLALIAVLVAQGLLGTQEGDDLARIYQQYLKQSLALKLLDRPVLVGQQEMVVERGRVKEIWQNTFA